jgi:hypothetical protein
MSEKRIYVVVADTVQHPLMVSPDYLYPTHKGLVPNADTKTIVQPKGRIAAQVGHVVSRMRMSRLAEMHEAWAVTALRGKKTLAKTLSVDLTAEPRLAYTTIVLAVPDSYNLRFRCDLLQKAGLRVFAFYDQNEEYGEGSACTAICTEPIEPEKTLNVLDYLPLWR